MLTRCGLRPQRRRLSRSLWERGSAVSDELKALKANGFAEGENTARQAFTIGGNGKRR
jgi:hypothetical protein